MSSIGYRIKMVRKALNLSQEQFGAFFDASKAYISAVENNKSKLSVDSLVKLLIDYDVNINYVLAGIGDLFIEKESINDNDFVKKVEEVLIQKGLI